MLSSHHGASVRSPSCPKLWTAWMADTQAGGICLLPTDAAVSGQGWPGQVSVRAHPNTSGPSTCSAKHPSLLQTCSTQHWLRRRQDADVKNRHKNNRSFPGQAPACHKSAHEKPRKSSSSKRDATRTLDKKCTPIKFQTKTLTWMQLAQSAVASDGRQPWPTTRTCPLAAQTCTLEGGHSCPTHGKDKA